MGFFEQKIMVNYEYYYYTKKIYELSIDKQISELYKENQELEKFIKNNYLINNNTNNKNKNKNKEEILTLKRITQVVDELRGDEKFNKKIKLIKDIFNKICEEKPCYIGKEILFNDELSLEVYNSLNKELNKEKVNYVSKLVESISFISFLDIINLRQNILYGFRKMIIDSQCNLILDELNAEGFLHKKNKKHNKKKKKKDNSNINKNNGEEKKQSPKPHIKINIYDVQTKEIECEYNMNSRSQQFNMIQENASNVIINSYNNNNNIFIRGNKKPEEKKLKKVETPKKTEEKVEKIEKKEEKIEIKNEEKKEIKNEEKKEEDNKEEEKDAKTKEKNKKKEFFLYPINKKKSKDNNNINKINEIKETKEKPKNNKHKKQKNLKEDFKEVPNKNNNKNYKKFNFVQERKNNVQINPCPRRKKKVSFQTSSINFEMHMKPNFDSYPYYYSFPMMKPFTSLSEVSTKFSMPSTINNNNEIQTNKNSVEDKRQKSHWDYSQYINNYNNNLQLFNSFIPSEKYFDSLNKELNNYLSVTNLNIKNLKNLYEEKLEKIENLIQNGLSENYEIKFGHYGSFFSNLSIEGSDLDILIYYNKKKEDSEFYKDILNLLEANKNKFENVNPILTASVPVIKLQIDIKNEILEKDIKLKDIMNKN